MQHPFILLSLLLLLYRFALILATPIPTTTPPPPPPNPPTSLLPLLTTLINTTITLSTLNSPPPPALMTTIHSQECIDVNSGQLLCCEGILDGDQPVVLYAAELFGLGLNRNSVNGLGCKALDDDGYCAAAEHRLCCQVTDLMVLPLVSLAMWCHSAE